MQENATADEDAYIRCLVNSMEGKDAVWAYWALMGSYHVRVGTVNYDETFGLLTNDWSGWRNGSLKATWDRMFDTTQSPE